jgi:hypothetical protein
LGWSDKFKADCCVIAPAKLPVMDGMTFLLDFLKLVAGVKLGAF